jgi:hypothetical protein
MRPFLLRIRVQRGAKVPESRYLLLIWGNK